MQQRNTWEQVGTIAQMGAQSAAWPWQFPQPGGMPVPLDVCEFADEIVVRAMLPGLSPNDLHVTASESTLTLKGEFVAPDWLQKAHGSTQASMSGQQPVCWIHENPVGRFARTITLPFPVDAAHGRSTFDNGVLTLHLPKSQSRMMETIPVQSGSTRGS